MNQYDSQEHVAKIYKRVLDLLEPDEVEGETLFEKKTNWVRTI